MRAKQWVLNWNRVKVLKVSEEERNWEWLCTRVQPFKHLKLIYSVLTQTLCLLNLLKPLLCYSLQNESYSKHTEVAWNIRYIHMYIYLTDLCCIYLADSNTLYNCKSLNYNSRTVKSLYWLYEAVKSNNSMSHLVAKILCCSKFIIDQTKLC